MGKAKGPGKMPLAAGWPGGGACENIVEIDGPGYRDDKVHLYPAPPPIRRLAQELIDTIPEHRHLRKAKILLLIRTSESDKGGKPEKPKRISLGHAKKTTPILKALASLAGKKIERPDFFVTLTGAWLEEIGLIGEVPGQVAAAPKPEALRQLRGLLDHELSHCGVVIAWQFIAPDGVALFVKGLGDRWIETRTEIKDSEDNVLVRYMKADDDNQIKYKVRKHEVEDFPGVIERNGAWCPGAAALVDVVEKAKDKGLFDSLGDAA